MIIGKSGNYIKQIKEESGAYIQISQKSKEINLPERCVTIAGKKISVSLILEINSVSMGQDLIQKFSNKLLVIQLLKSSH